MSRLTWLGARLRTGFLVLFSAIAEKNPIKALSVDAPVSLSMSRITVLVFTIAMADRLTHAKALGWPEATLSIALVLALPLLTALSKLSPREVALFGTALLARFGVGDVAQYPPLDTSDERGEFADLPDPRA